MIYDQYIFHLPIKKNCGCNENNCKDKTIDVLNKEIIQEVNE